MISIDLIVVSIILISSLLLLASNRFPADMVLLGALCFLLVGDILTPTEALAGLSNPGIATILISLGLRGSALYRWLSCLLCSL